jgi:hypothetical protein
LVERYSNYSELPSFELVEFYVSEKIALEEFSLFHKIFTPVNGKVAIIDTEDVEMLDPSQTNPSTGDIKWMDELMDTVSMEDAMKEDMDTEESNTMLGHSGEEAVAMGIMAGPVGEEMVLGSLEPIEMETDHGGLDKKMGPEEEDMIMFCRVRPIIG